jgi:hypothetical protein
MPHDQEFFYLILLQQTLNVQNKSELRVPDPLLVG